jgi:hypothetical protein
VSKRTAKGIGLFYTRDSEGRSDLAPPQYVEWARGEAARLGVGFGGTPEAMQAMIARGVSAEGDLFVDYGVSGNLMSRPGFDAFRGRALSDRNVSHLFVPRRDRIARPDNPLDAVGVELELRRAGLTLVFMNSPPKGPVSLGERIELADLLTGLIDYDNSGKFRRDLAEKLIHAKIRLAKEGFSIGGDPLYGFRRWLVGPDGAHRRELERNEIVKMPGHHVMWLPTAEGELAVVRRILELIETTPACRIAQLLNDAGVPSPAAGRLRSANGVAAELSGLWTQNTVKNIAKHPLLVAVWEYGKRCEGDQMRFTKDGPRSLGDADFGADNRPRNVANTAEQIIVTPARFEPLITEEKRGRVLAELERRGRHLKGKARTRAGTANPLGGRVYDLGCGWPMYRYARRGKWQYTCALYQNSEAKCCHHNVIDGAAATRFVLGSLQQLLQQPTAMSKLRARLEELAAAGSTEDPVRREFEAASAELARVRKDLTKVSRNMALAETPEERAATAAVFRELKARESALEVRVNSVPKVLPAVSTQKEVEAALGVMNRLNERVGREGEDLGGLTEVFAAVDAKLYLRFAQEERGRRHFSVPAGGVLTFGSAPAPGPLYDGPTDRALLRKRIAAGEPVTAVPGCVASGASDAGQGVEGSANVQRGTKRCT